MSRFDEDLAIETLKSAINGASPKKSMYEVLLDAGLTPNEIQAVTIKLASRHYDKTAGPVLLPRIGNKKVSR
jgi:hypothetical protein